MEELDLDINNYNLKDILNLFKLSEDFTENDLKKAKQIVLKTHPDKSKLDAKYFLFFSKAYKTLYSIHIFKNNSSKKGLEKIQYNTEDTDTEGMKKHLNTFFKTNEKLKDSKEFNHWFNEQFDKYKTETEEQQSGYGDWLKSNEDCDEERNISMSEMQQEIERKKRQVKDLVVHKDVTELYSRGLGGSTLGGEAPQEFNSDLFSNLTYQDLRQAHRESVIPVTNDDYNNIKKFRNVNDYSIYRDSQDIRPLSETQAQEYLNNKNKITEIESSQRAFLLAKQYEEAKIKKESFLGTIKKIEY